ncbi:heparinase II/III family protein [Actinoplanes sp. NBRC 101535]|uniref:heparinase II/III domain-containing protein n=1 Tax=Actinoplanes sp. NBRC 101535 TaxID=3032196 RepID=UPI002554E0EE|nr:heparinase II/III family protein [Actinoplanes sp. NBRC 101535]
MRSQTIATGGDRNMHGPLSTAWLATGRTLAPPGASLPVPTAADRDVWDPSVVDPATLSRIRDRALASRGTPWAAPLGHLFARYFRDGDRAVYEQAIYDRQDRLTRAAIMAAVTREPEWLDEVTDGVVLLCEQSTWCWPAHDDTYTRHGSMLPTADDPFLDLGAGEVAGQLAWLDHLLGEQLDAYVPGLRARIRLEADRRVFTPFEQRRDWHWLGLDGDVHNWNPWIHGNVLTGALQLVASPGRRAALVDLIVEGLDRYVASLPADGAIDEGYAYWWNGACRLLEAAELLADASGADVPWSTFAAVVAFPHRMHLGGDWYLNHADGPARPPREQPWAALHRMALRIGDPAATAHAAVHRDHSSPVADERQGFGRLLQALTSPAWLAATPPSPAPPADMWFASTQVMLARAGRLALAVKGGHNGEHHNHNDVGSVVVALSGVPVVVDPGRPTYTAQTFGPRRYEIWTMQSTWHSTVSIGGVAQGHGRGFAASEAASERCGSYHEMVLNVKDAYPAAGIHRWLRTARLSRSPETVTLRDSWDLDPSLTGSVIHLVLAGAVTLAPGRAEVTALDGAGTLLISWDPAGTSAALLPRTLDDPMLSDVWGARLTRLDIDVSGLGPIGTLELTLKEQR